MKVYFISGIGADHRLFKKIILPAGFDIEYLPWIAPQKKETIESYATRLAAGIDHSQPFVLSGLSLGGIVAAEIAKLIQPACIILISSVPVAADLPPWYGLSRRLGLTRLMPATFFKITASVKHILTTRSRMDLRTVLQVIWSGDNRFIRWGMNAVPKWGNHQKPKPLYHIHGTRDEVFPVQYTSPTHLIRGGHMLVLNNAAAVNEALAEILANVRY